MYEPSSWAAPLMADVGSNGSPPMPAAVVGMNWAMPSATISATRAVTVVDYKTGSIAESAQEYRTKVARFLDFQLPFYYWARTAAGDRVSRLALVPLKDSARDVRPVELEVVPVAAPRTYDDAATGTIGIDELERARAKMIELAALLADGPLERFAVTTDPGACVYCAYKAACRERPLPREDRFGR